MSTFPHAKRRNTLKAVLIWAMMMVPASALLYGTSSHVGELEKERAALSHAIVQEKEALRVMHAEWAYLNNPQRLSARAKTHLGFKAAPSARQIASLSDMSMKIAYRGEALSIAQAALPAMQKLAATPTRMLAKPIAHAPVYAPDTAPRLVDALAPRDVKLPAAANWQARATGAFNAAGLQPAKGRTMP